MKVLGIDLGTTTIKGAVLDVETGAVGRVRRRPFPDPLPSREPLFQEFDPGEIIGRCEEILAELSQEASGAGRLFLCGQMHGVCLMSHAGEALGPFVGWKDQRALLPHPSGSGTHLDVMAQRLGPEWLKLTGNELRPGLASAYLFWLVENGQAPPPGARLASVGDLPLAAWSGAPPRIDLTNAAAFGLVDLTRRAWSEDAIERLGLTKLQWPEIWPSEKPAYFWRRQGRRWSAHVPVGDHQAALRGIGLGDDELSLNISTGSQVARLTDRPIFGDYQTRPFLHGRFLNTITHIPAGRALNLLLDLLTEIPRSQGLKLESPWPYLLEQAEAVGDSPLEVDLSFFQSSVGSRGGIANVTQETLTVGHLFRAALANMADNYVRCAARIDPARSWKSMVLSGGLAQKSSLLRGLIEERFGQGYRLSAAVEETLRGLLALARAAAE